jgi:tetratricopeptide (TPR) repeat protein
MCPEQICGDPALADVRADVYSLGVVLHELLTGEPPYQLEGLALEQVVRHVREAVPPRPRSVPRDLGWVLLRSLEKDCERRYPSVSELAGDLRRFLAREPVLAGPPGAGYRLARFVRRHRILLGATAAVVAALSIGLVRAERSARGEARARRQAEELGLAEAEARRDAERQADKASQVTGFLAQIFTSAIPGNSGREALVVDALEAAARRIASTPAGDPEVDAAVHRAIGQSYAGLGLFAEARVHLGKSLEFVRQHLPPDHRFALAVWTSWIAFLAYSGQHAAVASEAPDALARAELRLGADHSDTLQIRKNLGTSLCRLGRMDEGEPLLRKNVELLRPVRDERVDSYVIAVHDLSLALLDAIALRLPEKGEQLEEVERLLEEALELARLHFPPDHHLDYLLKTTLAQLLSFLDRPDESEPLNRECLAWSRAEFGDDSPETAINLGNLAATLNLLDRFDEGIPLGREALLRTDAHFPRSHKAVGIRLTLSSLLFHAGNTSEAVVVAREGLDLANEVLPADHMVRLVLLYRLGTALMAEERWSEALDALRPASAAFERTLGADHAQSVDTRQLVAETLGHLDG